MTTPTVDLTDVGAFVSERHHAMLAWLRTNDPVHWHRVGDRTGFWALTRHDDVTAAYLDSKAFSSRGAMLGGSYRSATDSASGRMLVASDPPRHRLLRKLVHRVFVQEFVSRIETRVDSLVGTAFDAALAAGGCDFATDIAPEMPAGALMEIMGVSHAEAHELIGLTRRMIGYRDPNIEDTADDERVRLAMIQAELMEFFADIVARRRVAPGDDLASVLVGARLNGRPLDDDDIIYNCLNVAVGGNETTAFSATTGVLALIENPDQHAALRTGAVGLDLAIDEVLRWSTVNAYVLRVAAQDVELHGRTIRRGDSVTLWNASANRDERQFADPDRFLVDRAPNRHVAYGAGIHRCIGSAVAHAELPTVFRRLADHRVRLGLAGEVVRLRSNFIQGITSLPIHLAAA